MAASTPRDVDPPPGRCDGRRLLPHLAAEVVQPRQLPDGLLEVQRRGQKEADLFVVELATYPDTRIMEQLLRDLMLATRIVVFLPEVVVVILHPKGNVQVEPGIALQSNLGLTRLQTNWHVVRLWELEAETLLALNDPGLVPWVPLTHFDRPPEEVFQRCRAIIDQFAPPEKKANLLAVTQVFVGIRYNEARLLALFGGDQTMIESPVLDRLRDICEKKGEQRGEQKGKLHADRAAVQRVLQARYGNVPTEIVGILQQMTEASQVEDLISWAATCPDLAAFQQRLSST